MNVTVSQSPVDGPFSRPFSRLTSVRMTSSFKSSEALMLATIWRADDGKLSKMAGDSTTATETQCPHRVLLASYYVYILTRPQNVISVTKAGNGQEIVNSECGESV